MTKEELHAFAASGVAQKVAAMERELAVYHKEWPELFLSATVPQILKAPMKNGNGHWPAVVATNDAQAVRRRKVAASWTPERRAQQAAIMRKRQKAMKAAQAKARAAASGQPAKRVLSAATRRKLALAMKRRHESGEIARAKKAARGN